MRRFEGRRTAEVRDGRPMRVGLRSVPAASRYGPLLALQRRAGNRATRAAIDHANAPRASAVAVHRSLGLEFQTGWQIYHQDYPGAANQAYPKEQVIAGGRNSDRGWSMETDGHDIEFVIEPPFEEGEAGLGRLGEVMGNLAGFTKMMNVLQDAKQLRPQTHPHVFTKLKNRDAVIEPKGGSLKAQPQATVGVQLDRIEAFFLEMARESGDGQGDLASRQGTDFYARGAARAAGAAAALPDTDGQPASNQLKGIVTMLVQYLHQGRSQGRRAYAKDIAHAMARTDFAKMFSLVPEAAHFAGDPEAWVRYVLAAAEMPGTEDERLIKQQIADGQDTYPMTDAERANLPLLPLTRGEWLREMAQDVPKDLLTQAATVGQAAYTDVKGGNRLRAMGLLGEKTDRVGPEDAEGIILELRQMKRAIPSEQWHAVARSLLTYLITLNRWDRDDNAPTYSRGDLG